MEEFRGLLNLEIPGKKLINIVFFGLTEIEDCLRLDEPLAQRVAVKYNLGSLTLDITTKYINHRLSVAGAKRALFDHQSIQEVHNFSGGVPRLINTICDNCLFEAHMQKENMVQPKIVQSVAGDLGLLHQPASNLPDSLVEEDDLDEIESMLDQLEQK